MSTRDCSLDLPILESAKKEFLKKGFEKASLKEICVGANVTTGAVYKRYNGKEELFYAVISNTICDLETVLAEKININLKALKDAELIKMWKMDEKYMLWWFNFLSKHRDDFLLLLTGASNTKYSNFQHQWVERMTQLTYECYQEMYLRELTNVEISKQEIHVLLSAFWTTIYEPFIHNFSMDEVHRHCKIMCKFFDWYKVLGIK